MGMELNRPTKNGNRNFNCDKMAGKSQQLLPKQQETMPILQRENKKMEPYPEMHTHTNTDKTYKK